LFVNTAIATPDRYELRDADCAMLAFTAEGDLIVLDQPTGYDWRREDLRVDGSRETISLGPASSGGATYELVLSAPPCDDDADCDCGRLSRIEDGLETRLPLGRTCD
jgi:hypothetical protein